MTVASYSADNRQDGNLTTDPYRLRRFVDAQQPVLDTVSAELHQGLKQSHWMWFMFPQIQGLGKSAISREFSLASLDEARAYLAHPILGKRLVEMTRWMIAIEGRSAHEILGSPDDRKFHSSMTLFALAADPAPAPAALASPRPEVPDARQVFLDALSKFFSGEFDSGTLSRLT